VAVDDVTRDEAVRAVAEALHAADCSPACVAPVRHSTYREREGATAVDALIAAGWGDLAAERCETDRARSPFTDNVRLAQERDEAHAAIARIGALRDWIATRNVNMTAESVVAGIDAALRDERAVLLRYDT
jgi:hypothetical protein